VGWQAQEKKGPISFVEVVGPFPKVNLRFRDA
jgi:hypothetical protein